ncbi:MAG TPA: c-type cytochrome [Opitutaceae bacterium]|nr:c-type cytochrome [Opitutaceae bacterium]
MRKLLKILGWVAGGLVLAIGVLALVGFTVSNSKLKKAYAVTVRPVLIPTSAEALARGKHIANTRGCAECHGKDFAGAKVIENGAMGRIHGSNLTRGRGSKVAHFQDTDWVRAIRHGVNAEGRGLFLMPSEEYSHFSDGDLGAVISYLKSVPPVDRDPVPLSFGPVTRGLLTTGKMKLAAEVIDHANVNPVAPLKAATIEYGRYLAHGCTGCHGPNFSGGKIDIGPPDWPPARNLTPHPSGNLSRWTEVDFMRALREGRRPDGTEVNPIMPRGFGGMDDVELRALFLFFRSLPPVETGKR